MNILRSHAKRLTLFLAMLLPVLLAGCGGHWNGPTLSAVVMSAASQSIPKAAVDQFTATAVFSDGTSADVTGAVAWSSSIPAVATVTSRGLATGVSVGSTLITASYQGKTISMTLNVTPALLNSIAVTPAASSLIQHLATQFTATGIYSDGTSQDLTSLVAWSPSNAVATVSASGMVTGVNVGQTFISASFTGKTGSTPLTVTAATLNSISIAPANPSTATGLTSQFTALGIFSDGTAHDVSALAAWSSNSAAATVNSTGLATGVAPGQAVISANFLGQTGSGTLTVSNASLNSIAVTPAITSIVNGLTGQFTAMGTFADGTTQDLTSFAQWSSTNTNAAIMNVSGSANSGLATGVGAGTASIRASFQGKTGSAALTVRTPALSSIAISPLSKNIVVAQTTQLAAVGVYDDGTTADLTGSVNWVSGNNLAVTFNPSFLATSGLATGAAAGTSAITATFGGKTGHATINVTVAGVLPLNPTAPALGETGRFVVLASQAITVTAAPPTKISNGDLAILDLVRSSYAGFTSIGTSPNLGGLAELTNGWSYAPDDLSPPFKPAPNAFAAPNLPYATIGAFITQIRTDLGIASSFLAANPNPGAPTQVLPIELGNLTLTRGVYKTASNVTLTTGTLHLDAQGDPNSVWIFNIGGTLNTGAPGGSVSLENGAQAKNVYWRTAGEAVLGTNTNFFGSVFAFTQVRALTGASIVGRLFGQTGQITLDANSVIKAP